MQIRLDEHKRTCRLGNNYSAVATHSLEVGHRIGFSSSAVVYRCKDRNQRRTIEGALISLNNTFENNKSSTKEDKNTNASICKNADIRHFNNISATLRTAASPLSSQVSLTPMPGSPDTGAYAVRPTPPEPPDAEDASSPRARRHRTPHLFIYFTLIAHLLTTVLTF